jgi:hypothetical protein
MPDDSMTASVAARLASLRGFDDDTLRALPASSTEQVGEKPDRFLLTVWHDELEGGAHRVVVQAYRPALLGSCGSMDADGFLLSPDGSRPSLAASDLYEFI